MSGESNPGVDKSFRTRPNWGPNLSCEMDAVCLSRDVAAGVWLWPHTPSRLKKLAVPLLPLCVFMTWPTLTYSILHTDRLSVIRMIVPKPYPFHYLLCQYYFWFTHFWFTPNCLETRLRLMKVLSVFVAPINGRTWVEENGRNWH